MAEMTKFEETLRRLVREEVERVLAEIDAKNVAAEFDAPADFGHGTDCNCEACQDAENAKAIRELSVHKSVQRCFCAGFIAPPRPTVHKSGCTLGPSHGAPCCTLTPNHGGACS